MSACAACNGAQGVPHTCPESGTFVAAEAHVAGEVDEIAAEWPTFLVTMHLRLRSVDEQAAREHLTRLVGDLLNDDLVNELDFGLQAYEVGV